MKDKKPFDDINEKVMDYNTPIYKTTFTPEQLDMQKKMVHGALYETEKDKVHRKLLDLMREVRYAYSRYEELSEQSDLDEMNEKQLEIIGMFDRLKQEEQTIINFIQNTYWHAPEDAIGAIRKEISDIKKGIEIKTFPCDIMKQLRDLVNSSGFGIPASIIQKIIEDNEEFVNNLKKANEKGVAPPQNWTHKFIKAIADLTQELDNYKQKVEELEEILTPKGYIHEYGDVIVMDKDFWETKIREYKALERIIDELNMTHEKKEVL